MRRGIALRFLLSACALPWSFAGCTLVAATRAPSPESGDEACHNYLDDDLDGAIDCDDLACDGTCTEDTLDACQDGRDNDGDGRVDGEDVRCWHLVPPSAERCATVLGAGLDPPIGSGSLVWRGTADLLPDPTDATRSVFASPGRVLRVAPVASTTGALDGLILRARLRASIAVETEILLVPAGELGDATTARAFTDRVSVTIGPELYLATEGSMGGVYASPPALSTPIWTDLELTVVGRTVHATISLGGGIATELPAIQLPASFVDPIALDVLVQTEQPATSDVPLLSSLRVERRALARCGRTELVPEMRADGFDLVLDVARGGDDASLRCAITADNGYGRAYVAAGDADWTSVDGELAPGDLMGLALAWDPDRHAFVGVGARGPSVQTGVDPTSFFHAESPDCRAWTVVPMTLPLDPSLEIAAHGMSYDVDDDGAHTLRMVVSSGDDLGVLTLASIDGAVDAFEPTGAPRPTGPDAIAFAARGASFGLVRMGRDDVVIFAATEGGLVVLTPRGSSGRFSTIEEPLLAPSSVVGTFDRGRLVGAPRWLPDVSLPDTAPSTGRLFYGGTSLGNCVGCVTSGSALLTMGGAP